jgi:hypothetical protein
MPRPQTGNSPINFPAPFGANFDLRGKQRKFIQIVRFTENPGGNPSQLERDNIIILIASGGLFQGWTTIPITSEESPAILTLEAFAYGIKSRTAHLHIWVDQRVFMRKLSKKMTLPRGSVLPRRLCIKFGNSYALDGRQ